MPASEPTGETAHSTTPRSSWPDATPEAWRAVVERDLKGAPFAKRLVAHTHEGLDIQPLYTARDWDHTTDPTGVPGRSPLIRGDSALCGVRSGWDVREERAEPEPEALNTAILEDLEHGATSVDIRLDEALADGPGAATGTGALLLSVDDLERALEGVHLGMITLALTPGAAFIEAAGLARAACARRGLDPVETRLAFNADPLAELARTGTLPAPVDAMLDRLAALAAWTDRELPNSTAVRVNTSPYHDANATAAQDLAFSMSTALVYLRAMERRGLTPARAAGQIVFRFSLSCNVFLAIAKLRAARRLWSEILAACRVPEGERTMRIEARTARRSLTHRDPWVNMLRNTTACFAAGVAGADTVVSVPFDEPLGAPDEMSRRVARNTQTILARESSLSRVADPAGGSWYLERLTDDLAKAAWAVFAGVEREGGMARALETGLVHEQLSESYTARLRDISKRKQAVTGVSEFPAPDEQPIERPAPDTAALAASAASRLAARRTEPELPTVLGEMRRELWAPERVDLVARAAGAGATAVELADALNNGCEPMSVPPLAPHPYAEPYEAIRDASDAYAAAQGGPPSVCLVAVGPAAEHTARVNFMAGFFGAGGFKVHQPASTPDAASAAAAFAELHAATGASVAAICAADPRYPDLVPELAPMLHAAGARTVVLAGRPGERELDFRNAGVDRFVYMGCDVLATLTELMHEEGALP
jgi:methylmalonyl-CoA mutase